MSSGDAIRIEPFDDRFGLVLNCAVRNALTSKTLLPASVLDYITPMIPKLNDRTLYMFCEDIKEKNAPGHIWEIFLYAVQKEREQRRRDEYAVDIYYADDGEAEETCRG